MTGSFPAPDDVNIALYRRADVVADYENSSGPRDCEAFLFSNHIIADSDILDLGVGAGRTTSLLAPLAAKYIGIDYSLEMIEAAKRSFPHLQFEVMDAADMSALSDRSFDVIVFSFNGLSYLYPDKKRLACLRECHRLLRQGGIFIFSLHNARSLLVRPTRTSHSLAATSSALWAALISNVARFCRRFFSTAFWCDHGYVLTFVTHGSLKTFAASCSFVRGELEANGFAYVASYGEQYPRHMPSILTRWNYYVFRKGAHIASNR